MSAELALHRALIERLREDAGLQALLGEPARVFDEPPEETAFPQLIVGRTASRPWGGLEGEGLEHVVTLTAVSRFDGTEEARAIAAATRACLDGATPEIEGRRLVSLRVTFVDVFRASAWKPVLAVIRLRAVTEPM